MTAFRDLTGERHGRWTALSFSHRDDKKIAWWLYRCDCGQEAIIRGTSITSGNSTGCTECQRARARGNKHAQTHGHTAGGPASPTFQSWKAMKARCSNPNNASWEYYGGRGIKVCGRWYHSFEAFLEDMGERPPGTILERRNPNGDYCKENCYWATPKEARATQRPPRLRVTQ